MAKGMLPDWLVPVQIPALDGFARSGIYFLHRELRVVYVGQAVDMRRRIGQHLGEGVKVFDAVSFEPCDQHELDRRERYHIERLVPEYNACRLSNQLRCAGAEKCEQPPIERRVTAPEAAAFLGLTAVEFAELCRSGLAPRVWRLPRRRSHRFDLSELEGLAIRMAAN